MYAPIVSIQQLSHHFGAQTVLDNISLTVPAGCIYGLLGPNGAGKTTTLRLLLGLIRRQSGHVHLFGQDISHNRLPLLRQTGSLIEHPSLYLHLTARENLEIYRLAYQCEKKRIGEVLDTVQLVDAGKKKVKRFSLGMRQRLAIAIALLPDPPLLILDEPSNGLDPIGMLEMRNLLLKLHAHHAKTVIVSSHLLPEVEKIATRLAIIHQGKVLFEGSLPELHELNQGHADLESLFMDIIVKHI
ncbi:ATP-binding cassette domain-containing protein [Paraflavitalea sp. CAU 1676]|uniref:ATP-binding cassette domain-containing protein n=1 Tax=Paraflavitalea sp. CAU 1676 TaxID=3032598 RepID=UPI0023D98BF6|nr:ATP-binding cassette domain-containing protein [Paraflavitalea sp. CAU 1676]MDF2193190.1 ATP-binding cassette domain-containing protein [Paraflavitalea sp. CAU 1676]